MKYLITGAAGFVGSHLSARLASDKQTVLGVDNFSPYYSPQMKALRVAQLLTPLGVQVKEVDLCDLKSLKEVVTDFKPDAIMHLAAQPGVRTPLGRSFEYIQNNLVAFTNTLQTAVEAGVQDFLYASSSSVYGNSEKIPYSEDDNSIRPISVYGATKLANEILAPTYVAGSQTRARGLRFFTVYGPWGRPDMAYFRLIESILNDTPFKKFGGGEVKRDFTYVDDITRAIQSLSDELSTRPHGFSDVVNIGGGRPHSLNDLISVISQQLGSEPKMTYADTNPNDTLYTSADISRLYDLTKSVPKIDLQDGVKSTISWAMQPEIQMNLNSWINSTN